LGSPSIAGGWSIGANEIGAMNVVDYAVTTGDSPVRRRGRVLTYNQMVVDEKPIRDDEGATDLLFGALADPIRRDILRRAHEGRLSVSALAREHPISVTAMQKHVAVLERAELVRKHRVGRESIVQTQTDGLARAHAALDRLEAEWRHRIDRMEQILETDKGDN
jgi:DNA-binding transcriptional ArsR family regulator